ncbi:hypothetical protein N825_25390 [Skermanella stibiiresistens SB22]|uniref:Structural protein P5 n=1 Tax=Skermanella stibiiresistens SB22 TaxID=1385369 RepID=W9GVV9_9PROT|nr:hypothetical protein [Skermanella stibiiresistens]EWY36771.1 hypothetical protein N825_25390 [Skermanella stibiiresistens SB22]
MVNPRQPVATLPRGIRNNNPGNIERTTPPTKWQGLASDQSGDKRFVVFQDPAWGIRALARVLITYADRHDCGTVRKIVTRWAPPNENVTVEYCAFVAGRLSCGVDQPINVHDHAVMRPLVEAIITKENGQQPYDAATIDKGLLLAGIQPPPRPLVASRTIIGAGVAGLGAVAGAAVQLLADPVALQAVTDGVAALPPSFPGASILSTLVTLAGVAMAAWARIDDRRRGLR